MKLSAKAPGFSGIPWSAPIRRMRLLANLVAVALLTTAFCSGSASAQDQKHAVETLIHDCCPGYHLMRIAERDMDTRAFLLKRSKVSDPSVIHADLDGDGKPDYAMLLKSDTSAKAKFVVLLCDVSRPCRRVYEMDVTGDSQGTYLSRLPIGSIVAPAEDDESAPLKLRTNGIQLSYFEKAELAFYWDRKLKKIVELGTGD